MCRLYGQKLLFQSAIWSQDGRGGACEAWTGTAERGRHDRRQPRLRAALLHRGLRASASCRSGLQALSLFGDREESVYRALQSRSPQEHERRRAHRRARARASNRCAAPSRHRHTSPGTRDPRPSGTTGASGAATIRHMSTELNYQFNYGRRRESRAVRDPMRPRPLRIRGRRRRVALEQRVHLPDSPHRRYARDDVSRCCRRSTSAASSARSTSTSRASRRTIAGMQTQRETCSACCRASSTVDCSSSDEAFLARLAAAPPAASRPRRARCSFAHAIARPSSSASCARSPITSGAFARSRRYVLLDDSTNIAAANRDIATFCASSRARPAAS